VHDKLTGVKDAINEVLHNTTLEEFRIAYRKKASS